MKIKEIMHKAIVVEHDMSLERAAKIMSEKKIGSLIILKENEIVGIITESDIVKNASNMGRKISSAMSKNVIVIDQDESLDNAAALMTKNKIKRLPVVSEDKLVGIVTATDLIENSEGLDEDFIFD